MRDEQVSIPFPPDPQQLQIMRQVVEEGNYLVASEGTTRYELCNQMADGGYMNRAHCPQACDVHQFSVTRKGRAAIDKDTKP